MNGGDFVKNQYDPIIRDVFSIISTGFNCKFQKFVLANQVFKKENSSEATNSDIQGKELTAEKGKDNLNIEQIDDQENLNKNKKTKGELEANSNHWRMAVLFNPDNFFSSNDIQAFYVMDSNISRPSQALTKYHSKEFVSWMLFHFYVERTTNSIPELYKTRKFAKKNKKIRNRG